MKHYSAQQRLKGLEIADFWRVSSEENLRIDFRQIPTCDLAWYNRCELSAMLGVRKS